jgi:hypothetical protein
MNDRDFVWMRIFNLHNIKVMENICNKARNTFAHDFHRFILFILLIASWLDHYIGNDNI